MTIDEAIDNLNELKEELLREERLEMVRAVQFGIEAAVGLDYLRRHYPVSKALPKTSLASA